jgi:hypothetical protein
MADVNLFVLFIFGLVPENVRTKYPRASPLHSGKSHRQQRSSQFGLVLEK